MKTIKRLLIVLTLGLALPGFAWAKPNRDVLFQFSTFDALFAGIYEGDLTLGELKKHGDIGIGTFNSMDGEMAMLDGKFYRIAADGIARLVPLNDKTPFATVTFFEADKNGLIDEETDIAKLTQYLDSLIPSNNLFYAIRIDGQYSYVKTRSVPKQSRPYPSLVEITAHQPTFEFTDARGTLVGFRAPYFTKGVMFPGYHFHFLTDHRDRGGHVLECRVRKATVAIDITPEFRLVLPGGGEFWQVDLPRSEGEPAAGK